MHISVFILGVIGITAQSVYLREVLSTFRAGELTTGAALLFWLMWTSVGSGLLGRYTRRIGNPGTWFHTLLPWYGICGYAGVCAIGAVPYITRLTPGELVPFDLQFTSVALALLPFNILGGFLFTLGVKALEREDSPSAGRAFTLEAFGSALAGVCVSLILITFLNNNAIALICPLLGICTSLVWGIRKRSRGSISRALLPLVLLAVVIWWHGRAYGYNYRGQTLLKETDTKYGRLRVTRRGEQVTFYSNASTLFSAPDYETSEYRVHIPMLVADNPETVLVLGGGPGGIIEEVLKYQSVDHVTCVEIDPGLFSLADRYLEEKWRADPRVEVVFADGRAFMENTERQFDVIVMNMPSPLSGVANRYYTKEFFSLSASRLTERGIMAFSLTGAENYIADDLAMFLASVRETLRLAFPSVRVLPGLQCRFLAANSPGLVDATGWEDLDARRSNLGIETLYVRDYFLRFTMSPRRVAFLTENLDAAENPVINSDTKPSSYFSRTIVQGNLDNSSIIDFTASVANADAMKLFIFIIIIITVFFAGIPGKRALGRTVMAAVMSVGMTEISLEVLAIMAYQSIFGYLYGRIALLVGFYMGGLAAGGLIGTRLVERGRARTTLLAAVQSAIALIPLLWILLLWSHTAFPGDIPLLEAYFFILTALSGLAGGFQFPVADSLYRASLSDRRAGPGAIYGVDLAGSSVGALITGSLMIPIIGMIPVLAFLAALNGITAGVMWLRTRGTTANSS